MHLVDVSIKEGVEPNSIIIFGNYLQKKQKQKNKKVCKSTKTPDAQRGVKLFTGSRARQVFVCLRF